MQRPPHMTRLALGIEPVGNGKRIRIRFEHRMELGIELGDAREVGGADGARGARAGAHGILELGDGDLFQVKIGRRDR